MKIALIGNYPADGQTSMLRYAAFLQRELENAGHQVRLLSPRSIAGMRFRAGSRFSKWLGYIDKFVFFKPRLMRLIGDADVVHVCDHSNAMYLAGVQSIPKLITCHDTIAIRSALGHYPDHPTRKSGRVLQTWIFRSLNHADRIIYVSNKTRFDFEELLGVKVPADTIRHALNWPYSPAKLSEVDSLLGQLRLENHGYIVHVGGNQWYKNRKGVMQMFLRLRSEVRFQSMKLVMVGKPLSEDLHDLARANGLNDLIELQNVSNEHLRILYTGAFALLFPSLEEGFGWPVLEAQACGCPVITSNREPMTEIAGQGAKFVDPEDPDTIVAAASACYQERLELVDSGFRNLARFASSHVVRSYEEVYRAAIASGSHSVKKMTSNS